MLFTRAAACAAPTLLPNSQALLPTTSQGQANAGSWRSKNTSRHAQRFSRLIKESGNIQPTRRSTQHLGRTASCGSSEFFSGRLLPRAGADDAGLREWLIAAGEANQGPRLAPTEQCAASRPSSRPALATLTLGSSSANGRPSASRPACGGLGAGRLERQTRLGSWGRASR
jgi:hypothetical protein